MSIGPVLGNLGSNALNITMTITPQGRALGAANELMGGGAQGMIGALADTVMNVLFGEPGQNGLYKMKDFKDGNIADSPLMQKLAEFMDASPGAYGKPHDASGAVGNWKDELSEDPYLNQEEYNAFKQGLIDALGLNGRIMGGMGGEPFSMNPFAGGMGGGMGGGMSPATGGMGGGMGGGMSPVTGGMGGGMGGGMSPVTGGMGGGMGGMSPFAGGMRGLGNSAFGGSMSGMGQTGMGFGLDLSTHTALQGLNDIGTHKDGYNRHFVNEEDRGSAKEIGKFMDQHPEIYGKPEYQKDLSPGPKTDTKSWEEALSNPDDDGMTGDSMDKFKDAKNTVKNVMLGDTSKTPDVAMQADAMLVASNIADQRLGKLGG